MLQNKKVVAIVPAYNEAPRISRVLDTLCKVSFIDQVVVVDDGSRDETWRVASAYPVVLLRHPKNSGKAKALVNAIRKIPDADIYLFIDADLINLREEHLHSLASPLAIHPFLDMTIGVFKGGRESSDLAQKLFPILNGQRAVRGEWIRNLPDFSWCRFGVEVFITRYARQFEGNIEMIPLWGISHYHKEEKYGPFLGLYHRIKMYLEIFKTYLLFEKKIKNAPQIIPEAEKESEEYARL